MSAEMLDRLSSLWLQHFPGCTKRAHWHLANLLRFETGPLGATFAQAEGYLKAKIGADQETTKVRLGELLDFGLLDYEDANLSARAVIKSTERLFENYSAYSKALITEIFKYAGIDPQLVQEISTNSKLEEAVYSQTKLVYRELNIGRETYISKNFPNDISQAIRINYAMRRRSHWTIFLVTWINCIVQRKDTKQRYIIAKVWERGLEEGADTVCGYITDLVAWKFISLVGRQSYVINTDAVTHFSELFDEVGASMRGSALQIKGMLPGAIVCLRSATL